MRRVVARPCDWRSRKGKNSELWRPQSSTQGSAASRFPGPSPSRPSLTNQLTVNCYDALGPEISAPVGVVDRKTQLHALTSATCGISYSSFPAGEISSRHKLGLAARLRRFPSSRAKLMLLIAALAPSRRSANLPDGSDDKDDWPCACCISLAQAVIPCSHCSAQRSVSVASAVNSRPAPRSDISQTRSTGYRACASVRRCAFICCWRTAHDCRPNFSGSCRYPRRQGSRCYRARPSRHRSADCHSRPG